MSIRMWIFGAASWLLIAAGTRAQDPGYTDTPRIPGSRWRVHDAERPVPPIVAPGTAAAGVGAFTAPPADAVVLFDGEDLSDWTGAGGFYGIRFPRTDDPNPGDIAMLKVQASETLEFCAREAMQILGGIGYMRGNRVERIYREVRVNAIGGGSEEIMRDLASRQYGV